MLLQIIQTALFAIAILAVVAGVIFLIARRGSTLPSINKDQNRADVLRDLGL